LSIDSDGSTSRVIVFNKNTSNSKRFREEEAPSCDQTCLKNAHFEFRSRWCYG
jgi:hypothetical protein